MSDNTLVYALNQIVTAPGSIGIGTIKDEGKIRFITAGAGPANVVRVRARINNQNTWTTLLDLTGNTNQVVDIFTFDQVEVICLVFDAANGIDFKIVGSSFDGAQLYISTPDGDLGNISGLTFISSDNSIDISADPLTNTIDFIALGGGGGAVPFVVPFLIADWGVGTGTYDILSLESVHNKGTDATIQVFEDVLGIFEEVETIIEVNGTGDITIKVSQSPDLRFNGKLIIS